MSTENIIHSKHAPVEYPAISMGEYLKTALTKHDPNTVAFVSFLTNIFNFKNTF